MYFIPKVQIDNIEALVQIMAWRLPGNKPLSGPMIAYWRIYALADLNYLMMYIYTSLGLNEFKCCL